MLNTRKLLFHTLFHYLIGFIRNSLQRAADRTLFPHHYGIKRAQISYINEGEKKYYFRLGLIMANFPILH